MEKWANLPETNKSSCSCFTFHLAIFERMGSQSRDAVSQLKCCANLWRELIGQCKVYTSLSLSPLENATCVCDCFVLCLPCSEDGLIGIIIVWDDDDGHGLQGCLPLRGYSGYTVFAGETVLEAFDRRNITSP